MKYYFKRGRSYQNRDKERNIIIPTLPRLHYFELTSVVNLFSEL